MRFGFLPGLWPKCGRHFAIYFLHFPRIVLSFDGKIQTQCRMMCLLNHGQRFHWKLHRAVQYPPPLEAVSESFPASVLISAQRALALQPKSPWRLLCHVAIWGVLLCYSQGTELDSECIYVTNHISHHSLYLCPSKSLAWCPSIEIISSSFSVNVASAAVSK